MAEPARISSGEPSPQLTDIDAIVPSGSPANKLAVTVWPVLAGLGDTLTIDTLGALSFTVSGVIPDPGPALLVAVTVIVNNADFTLPVEE